MRTLKPYLEALVYNGPVLTACQANAAGISLVGCPHRGTSVCHGCPYQPAMLCAYTCATCAIRELCPCGSPELAPYRPLS